MRAYSARLSRHFTNFVARYRLQNELKVKRYNRHLDTSKALRIVPHFFHKLPKYVSCAYDEVIEEQQGSRKDLC